MLGFSLTTNQIKIKLIIKLKFISFDWTSPIKLNWEQIIQLARVTSTNRTIIFSDDRTKPRLVAKVLADLQWMHLCQ